MQTFGIYPLPSSSLPMVFASHKAGPFKRNGRLPAQHSLINKKPTQKDTLNPRVTSSSHRALFSTPLHQKKMSSNERHFQENQVISLIKDPLWKKVCTEFVNMMGPGSAHKIWKSRLGTLSPHYKIICIYCETKEESEFLQMYSFVVLGTLQKYFPAVKVLNVKTNQQATITA